MLYISSYYNTHLCLKHSRDLLSEDTSYKMEVKMNPEGGGLHIPGLSYVNVDSVEHVNEVLI